MRLLLLFCLFPCFFAQSFFSHLMDDLNDDDRPRLPIVRHTRVLDDSSEEEKRKATKVIGSHIDRFIDSPETILQAPIQSLFSRMFEILRPAGFTFHTVDGRRPPKKLDDTKKDSDKKEDSKGDKEEKGPLDTVMNVFDTIGAIPFASANQNLRGPHICVREVHNKLPATEEKISHRECRRFQKAYRCVEKKLDWKGGYENSRIQECCDGFDTEDIVRFGCTKEILLMSIRDTLLESNSSLPSFLDDLGMGDLLDSKSRKTLIVPPNEALEKLKFEPDDIARSTLLNHILPTELRDFELTDGQEIESEANATIYVSQKDDGHRQKTNLNCISLKETNVRATNGILHYSSDTLNPSSANILEYLESTNQFKTFVSLITPDLERDLRSSDRFTVFAFSDKAFAELNDSVRINVMSKSACASDIIQSHIVQGSYCASELEDKGLVSLGGYPLRVQMHHRKNGTHVIRVGNAKIVEENSFTQNGVIHIIDDVIILDNLLTWRDHLKAFNTPLLDALSTLSMDAEPITLFVPPLNDTESFDIQLFALNHILEHSLITSLDDQKTVTTDANSTIFLGTYARRTPLSIRVSSRDIRIRPQIGCSHIIRQSIHACNSILHFIDKPLPFIDSNLTEFLSSRSDLNRFTQLWKESDIAHLMNTSEPITVFAPSDDAMSRNEYNRLLKNSTRLNKFVRRYIVQGPLCSSDLRRSAHEIKFELISNLASENLNIETTDGELFVDGAKVQEEELLQSNAVVYVLESTIQKPFSARYLSNVQHLTGSLFDLLN